MPNPRDPEPPPLFDECPVMDQSCGRWLGDANCGKPATWHFMWTEDGENSLCCDEHADESARTWSHHDKHPIAEVCTVPDSRWFFSWDEPPGCCRWLVSEDTMALARQQECAPLGGDSQCLAKMLITPVSKFHPNPEYLVGHDRCSLRSWLPADVIRRCLPWLPTDRVSWEPPRPKPPRLGNRKPPPNKRGLFCVYGSVGTTRSPRCHHPRDYPLARPRPLQGLLMRPVCPGL